MNHGEDFENLSEFETEEKAINDTRISISFFKKIFCFKNMKMIKRERGFTKGFYWKFNIKVRKK